MTTIRNAGITGDFVHEPLQHPGAEIRLVHVKASDASTDDIHCTISTHLIDNAPPYAAISYTWGEMACNRTVSLDGKRVSIGENSWLALWQTRLHKLPLPLWIDVLSIDQTDDNEKSIQVSIMGSIYEAARFTCVSLGHQKDDSEFLAEQIRAHAYHVEHVRARHGQARQEPEPCSACGSSPTHRMYRCRGCSENSRFCANCKPTHDDRAGHNTYLDVRTEPQFRSACVECEQSLSTRWYQPRHDPGGHLMKVCENCAEARHSRPRLAEWDCEYVHMNEWENMTRPTDLTVWHQEELQTFSRIFDLPQEIHQRIIDAFRLFSLRPYFSRLWIIQELVRSNAAIILCGESLFHFWKLDALKTDLTTNSAAAVYGQRSQDIEIRLPSWYLQTILDHESIDNVDSSIWDLVNIYYASYCSDPRDRVFALLSLADATSRQAFRPDYTQTVMEIILRLLEFKVKHDDEDAETGQYVSHKYDFRDVHDLVGVSDLGSDDPDIAKMLDRRRIVVGKDDSLIDAVQLDLLCRDRDACRLTLGVMSHCMIGQNEAGYHVAPLLKSDSPKGLIKHSFHISQQQGLDDAIRIRTLNGTVVGLTDKHTQPGDTLLFFFGGNNSMFHAGLVVRRANDNEPDSPAFATIVGQCIVDSDIKVCRGKSSCLCERRHPASHVRANLEWEVHMTPEDLLAFIAQDLKMEHRQPTKFEVPMVDVSVRWEESARRLNTRVTYGTLSSYAILKDAPDGFDESDGE